MKSTTLNVNSWHYKLASGFGYDPDFKDHDICAYLRRVVLGIVVVPFIASFAVLVIIMISMVLVNMVLGPWFYFMYGVSFDPLATVGWLVTAICATVGALFYCIHRYQKYRRDKRYEQRSGPEQEPGFLKLAYRSYKDRFCMKLQFVDASGNPYETERQQSDREWKERNALWEAEAQRLIAEGIIENDGTDPNKTTGSTP